MQADTGYDTTRLDALRRELKALNEKALADGLVGVRDGLVASSGRPKRATRDAAAKSKPAEPAKRADHSPAAAARLLAQLQREAGDDSPDVPGTTFTEAGIDRLLAKLYALRSRRGGAWLHFLQRAHRHLASPVAPGVHTIQEVGLERLQAFARQLEQIAAGGWAQFQDTREVRRRKLVPLPPLTQIEGAAAPKKARRKGSSR